ncbi:MAG: hypothetical protein HUU08_11215 [Candidatus Brocadia sp.]|nr:hypothetical protein [Candidatus Brocadia sp.]
MKQLVRYFKTISTAISIACLWAIFVTVAISSAYSSDNDSLDLTVTKFLDSLSFNYKGFDIKVMEVSVGEEFDDNVTYNEKNQVEDFITTLGSGLGVKYEGKTRSLEFLGKAKGRIYAENPDFNNITEELLLNFVNEFSRNDRIRLRDDFIHSDEPLFYREDFFSEQFGRTQGRFEYFRNNFHIDYAKDISKQLTVITKYDNSVNIFSGIEDSDNLENSVLNNPGFEIDYLFSSTTTSLFSYDFINRRFEGGEDASINKITAGIRQYITKKLYFDGRAGFDFIDSYDDKSTTKPVIFTSIAYQKDTDTVASISFDRQDTTSPYVDDVFENWRTTLSLKRQLMERFQGSLSIFYGEGEYMSSNFKTRLTGANATFRYDINQSLRGTFTYTYSHDNTSSEDLGYTKNTVFFGLAASF